MRKEKEPRDRSGFNNAISPVKMKAEDEGCRRGIATCEKEKGRHNEAPGRRRGRRANSVGRERRRHVRVARRSRAPKILRWPSLEEGGEPTGGEVGVGPFRESCQPKPRLLRPSNRSRVPKKAEGFPGLRGAEGTRRGAVSKTMSIFVCAVVSKASVLRQPPLPGRHASNASKKIRHGKRCRWTD